MSKRPSPPNLTHATDSIDVTFGVFDLGQGFRVPYMSSTLRFQQAAEYLNLVTDDPKYVTQDWSVEELFQRDVSQARVIDLVEHYLTSPSRPQFFNSLTIVLVPRDMDPADYRPPSQDLAYDRALPVGPIMVSFDDVDSNGPYPHALSHGRLSWNRTQVYAVAIDGQHRLAAIKELGLEAGKASSLSVLFIVLDEAIGYISSSDQDASRAMRSIFVDLNKRAVPVSRARNLLLDDIDPRAQFVRRLFGPALRFTPIGGDEPLGLPVGDNGEFNSRIPLVLVDWHGEARSKIEQGPYLSSVLALDWVVGKTLKAKHPKRNDIPDLLSISVDDDDYYKKIGNALQTWERSWNEGLREKWEDRRDKGQPFFFTEDELDSLADEYEETWGRAMTRLLTTVGPYAELVSRRMQSNTLTPQFSQWYQAKSDRDIHAKHSAKIRTYYESRFETVEDELRDTVNLHDFRRTVDGIDELKRESVFFYLVGQRALVWALIMLVEGKNAADLADACGVNIHDYRDNMQDFYAYYLGEAVTGLWKKRRMLFGKGCLIKRDESGLTDELADAFWAGALVKRDDKEQIDFSERAAFRGSVWFRLMAHMYWLVEANGLTTEEEIQQVVQAIEDESVLEEYVLGPQVMELIGMLGDARYLSPVGFLVAPLGDQGGVEVIRAATRERIQLLAEALSGGEIEG